MLDQAQIDELIRTRGLKPAPLQAQQPQAPEPGLPDLPTISPSALTGRELPVDIPGRGATKPAERLPPAPMPPAPAPKINEPAPAPNTFETDLDKAQNVIGDIEASGQYDIRHKPTKTGDQALGKYGFLRSGLENDSLKWYGRRVSEDEFLKSPDIQDKMFRGRFGDLVQKYGLEGAARAWFAGEGGMNNPGASDGNATVAEYSAKFMRAMGQAVPDAYKATGATMSRGEIADFIKARGLKAANEPDSTVRSAGSTTLADMLSDTGSSVVESVRSAGQSYMQYEAGVLKGIAGTALAPFQTASEMTGDWFKPVEARVAELEDALDRQTGGHGTWADMAGRVVGSVASIVVGARALGPLAAPIAARVTPAIAQKAWQAIGPLARGGISSLPLAATTYYPRGAENETRFGLEHVLPVRAIDAAMFGTLGVIGGVVTRGATWAAENLSRTSAALRQRSAELASEASDARYVEFGQNAVQKFNEVLSNTARNMTRNSEEPLRNTIAHYAQMENIARSKYGLRNVAGQQFEGFASGVGAAEAGGRSGFKQALDDAVAQSPLAGVERKAAAQTVERRVRDELGLTAQEGKLAEGRAAQAQYETQVAQYQQAIGGHPLRGAFQQNPQLVEQLRAAGQLPPAPVPPAPFVPEPVKAAQYLQARTSLNAAYRKTKDAALKTQLGQMLSAIDDVAVGEARTYGMEVAQFTRLAGQADRFYEQTIAPLRYGLFGGRTSVELAGRPGVPLSGMTPAAFHDLVTSTINKNDLTRVRDLAKVLGPEARRDMAGMAAADAILLSERGARKYVQDHSEVLRELLGKQEYEQLRGLATIAEHVQKFRPYKAPTDSKTSREERNEFVASLLQNTGQRVGGWLGFYQLGRGILGTKDRTEAFKEAGLYFFGVPAVHLAFGIVSNIHKVPIVRPLVRKAANMEPGSKELDDYLFAIERKVRQHSLPAQRGLSEAPDSQSPY